MNVPTLITQDLTLRSFTLHDASAVFAYASDIRVTRFTQWKRHSTLADSKQFIMNHHTALLWALTNTSGQEVFGECGLRRISAGIAEIHCALAASCWGKGYGYQALQAVLHFGFQEQALEEIHASCISSNQRSQALITKIGMTHKITHKHHWYTHGIVHDVAFYRITRQGFELQKEALPSTLCSVRPFLLR